MATDQHRIRRPRMTSDREEELLQAALEALREVGYDALSMDLVAARAHCSKATLYRLWQTKPQLVAAALYATGPSGMETIDTGSLRGDLVAVAQDMVEQPDKVTGLFNALANALRTDQDLAAAVRSSLVEPATANLNSILDRAVGRGELPKRPPAAQFLPRLLFGAVVTRPIFEGEGADVDHMTRFIDDVVLPALLTS